MNNFYFLIRCLLEHILKIKIDRKSKNKLLLFTIEPILVDFYLYSQQFVKNI